MFLDEVWEGNAGGLAAPSKLEDLKSSTALYLIQERDGNFTLRTYPLKGSGRRAVESIATILEETRPYWDGGNAVVAVHPHRVLQLAARLGSMRLGSFNPLEGTPMIDVCEWFYGNTTLTFSERASFGFKRMESWLGCTGEDLFVGTDEDPVKMAKMWHYYHKTRP